MTTKEEKQAMNVRASGSDTFYGLGLIGAWIYYFRRATTTEEYVKAFLKGLVWPVFLVNDLLVFLEKDEPA